MLPANQKYDFFVNVITDAIKTCTPRKVIKQGQHNNPVSWWDKECSKIKHLRKAACTKWNYTGDMKDLVNYNKMCAFAKKNSKIKKKEDFKKFA